MLVVAERKPGLRRKYGNEDDDNKVVKLHSRAAVVLIVHRNVVQRERNRDRDGDGRDPPSNEVPLRVHCH